MENIQKKNYLAPFIVLFIVSTTILSFISITISYVNIMQINQEITKKNLDKEINLKVSEINKVIENHKELLTSISNSYIFKNFLNKNEEDKNLKDLLLTIAKSNPNIMQLRFIDDFGNEKIRIDREKQNSKNVFDIPFEKLQNKEKRYYFQEIINKHQGQFYVSKLDLNIENNTIEYPVKPVLRIGTPVFDEFNYKRGVLILNIFVEDYLEKLVDSELFNIYVFDENYLNLYSNDNSIQNFEKYLSKKSNQFLANKNFEKVLLHESSEEKLFIALEPRKITNLGEHFYTILLKILFIVIPISIILAFILSRIPRNLLKKIEADHEIILHQSKQNAISEMIVMIAHQWRQPLTVISLISQEIIFSHKLDMLDKRTSEKLGDQLLEKIDFLSKSIDDFRDFFKKDDVTVDFDMHKSINEIKNIININLKDNNITMKINTISEVQTNEPFKINSNKTNFSQIMLNLLNNSIHAIERNCNYNEIREIEIELHRKINTIEITVKDTGKGIKENDINKIFDLYYSSDKEVLQGKGLGLYFVKNMIETKFNGSITVQNLENGAKFTLTFPLS